MSAPAASTRDPPKEVCAMPPLIRTVPHLIQRVNPQSTDSPILRSELTRNPCYLFPMVARLNEQQRGELGLRLKTQREIAGLTQDEMADRIGISLSSYSKWETGRVGEPRINHLRVAAEILGVSTEYLIHGASNGVDEDAMAELKREVREVRGLLVELLRKHDDS